LNGSGAGGVLVVPPSARPPALVHTPVRSGGAAEAAVAIAAAQANVAQNPVVQFLDTLLIRSFPFGDFNQTSSENAAAPETGRPRRLPPQ